MDTNRQVRDLIPPFVFVAWLLLGSSFDREGSLFKHLPILAVGGDASKILAVLIAGGSVVLAVGFLIASVSMFVMRGFGISRRFDTPVDDASLIAIGRVIGVKQPSGRRGRFLMGTFYDHVFLNERVYDWIVRRWNGCMVSVNSAFAMLLSHAAALVFGGVKQTMGWGACTTVAVVVVGINAWTAWFDIVAMHAFALTANQSPTGGFLIKVSSSGRPVDVGEGPFG